MNLKPASKPDSDLCSDVVCFRSGKFFLSGHQLVCGLIPGWVLSLGVSPGSRVSSLEPGREQCLTGAFPEGLKGVLLGCRRDA